MSTQTNVSASARRRCTVYIDGFNWYFAIVRYHPKWKWLNIQSLFEELRLDEEVVRVNFFTALVDPHKDVCEARDRLKRYLSALSILPKVKTILGKYQNREVTCRALCKQKYFAPEEKKTDVNIAVAMINDAVKALTDSIVAGSGDSDLEPAIACVRQ